MDYVGRRNPQHVCVVAAQSTYFEAYGRYIEQLSRARGYTVTYAGVPLDNMGDYREVATKFKHARCDVIFSWIPMGAIGGFFRRVRESGSGALLAGIVESDDPGVLAAAGAAADGVVFARFSIGSPEFQARYLARFGERPSRPAVPSYDGVKLLLDLVSKVGTDPRALKDAFIKVKDRAAENGTFTCTDEGERIGEEVELMQIVDGKPTKLEPTP
jgi:branched-chain amino acid transport system substrate-binding protein